MYRPSYSEKYTDVWPTNYRVGMWVWILNRLSGVVIAFYGIAHLMILSLSRSEGSFDRFMAIFHEPYVLVLELLLLAVIMFHVFNGFRIILFDLGIGIGAQKPIFWGLMGLALVLFAIAAAALAPSIVG